MKKIGLSTKILLGLIGGVLLGILINVFALDFLLVNIIRPIGTIFLNLMKMVIVPLIFTTLIVSITNVGDMNRLGFLGKKTIVYYLCTTLIAAFIGMTFSILLKPGAGVVMAGEGFTLPEKASIASLIVSTIPSNPVKALVEGNTLQIVVFAAFVGISINMIGQKVDNVKRLNASCAEIMYKMVSVIMKIAPIAVFALIAEVVATNGSEVLGALVKLVIVITAGSLVQCYVVYALSVKAFGKMSPIKFFKSILPAQIFSFTTASSAATLPISMKCAEEELNVPKTVCNFVLNLGATINMDGGAIYQAACAIFISQIYGIELGVGQLVIIVITASLASIGAAAIPGTVIVMMTLVLTSVGLPIEAIALIAGVDRILDMITTSVNVTGDLAATVFVAAVDNQSDAAEALEDLGVIE